MLSISPVPSFFTYWRGKPGPVLQHQGRRRCRQSLSSNVKRRTWCDRANRDPFAILHPITAKPPVLPLTKHAGRPRETRGNGLKETREVESKY